VNLEKTDGKKENSPTPKKGGGGGKKKKGFTQWARNEKCDDSKKSKVVRRNAFPLRARA